MVILKGNAVDEDVREPTNSLKKRRDHVLIKLVLLIALIAALAFVYWFLFWRGIESTEDAYVGGNLINVYPQVNGKAIAYYCDNTDLVQQGQLLVALDPTDFELTYEKAKEELALAVRRVVELKTQVEQKLAKITIARTRLGKARYDYENRSGLTQSIAISKQDIEHSQIEFQSTEAELKLAQYELAEKQAALGDTPLEQHPLVLKAKAALREAYINLSRTKILAPASGYIAKRNVQVGSSVSTTVPLMAIIPLDNVWVDANFKEVQLENIRIGQKASIFADIYGSSVRFDGRVVGIEPGSGSVFSLLPPQNAVGNWIKIVQRVPVRIALDPEQVKQHPLRLGLSVTANIYVSDTEGKMLAEKPSTALLESTLVYEISMTEVDNLIQKIIKANE